VKYADYPVLLAKEKKKRCYKACTINTLNEIGRCCGMEVNMETIKVMRISI
jgi:hypothetical protein